MIRRFRIQLEPNPGLQALEEASEAIQESERLSSKLADVASRLDEVIQAAYDEAARIDELLGDLEATELVVVRGGVDADSAEVDAIVFVDLRELSEDDSGDDAFGLAKQLIEEASRCVACTCKVRIGTELADSPEEGLEQIERAWREEWWVEEADGESGTWGSSDAGSWGANDLGGDPPPGNGKLGRHAQFFLEYVGLSWPVEPEALKRAWKTAARSAHPDKNPHAPPHLFPSLKSGHEELARLVMEVAEDVDG